MSVQGSSADATTGKPEGQNQTSFAQLDPPINPALLSALSSISLCYPTQVQKEFIPLALNGKDILARSSTGFRTATTTPSTTLTMAIILVPTRELSAQVTLAISSLCKGLGNENAIEIINLAGSDPKRSRRKHTQTEQFVNNILHEQSTRYHNEADLILSYGHSFDDIKAILSGSGSTVTQSWRFPTFFQSFLMSATMTSEVAELKSLVLRNPEVLYVKESINELSNLTQFSIKVPNEQDNSY
ncbi:hypothetical protein KEM48_004229 [Puccinia striiformis f. sp. tritici PST-130]|nr:hypothetical protein KEM48_004229 [Puccinia striiformis f. sp. tritici PST-130]